MKRLAAALMRALVRALVRRLSPAGTPASTRVVISALWAMVVPLASASACEPSADAAERAWRTLAPGVHVWTPAPDAPATPANAGHVMPTTVLVHADRAWVIDPGPNHLQGQRLSTLIACRWQARVERVINTHAHAENVLANSAFAAAQRAGRLQILATAGTAATMAQRCPECLADLRQRVGEAAMQGTAITLPDRLLQPGEQLVLGPHVLQVRELRQGHTASDLLLWDARRRIAWVGGLVEGPRLPELAQGSLLGWRQALAELKALQPVWVVGGTVSRGGMGGRSQDGQTAGQPLAQGTSAGLAEKGADLPPALLATAHYLAQLQRSVLAGLEAGRHAGELSAAPGPVPGTGWKAGPSELARHQFNLQRAWRELEPLWMQGQLPADGSLPDVGR